MTERYKCTTKGILTSISNNLEEKKNRIILGKIDDKYTNFSYTVYHYLRTVPYAMALCKLLE